MLLHLLLDEWPPLFGGSKDMPAYCKPYYYIKKREKVKDFSRFFAKTVH